MHTSFQDGKILATGIFCENAPYDVSNNGISAQFNGRGGISRFLAIDDKIYFDGLSVLKLYVGERELSFDTPKNVEMAGRTQKIFLNHELADAEITLFLNEDKPCVFERIKVTPKTPAQVRAALFMRTAGTGKLVQSADGRLVQNEQTGFCLASDKPFETEQPAELLLFDSHGQTETYRLDLAYGYHMPAVSDFVRHAETFENDAFDEIAAVSVPTSAATEMERALYVNAYFCALQNYKVKGDFKGFMAGCSYLFPARTYFRDSYFTVLAMYNGQTAKIREEILTLCRGVSDDGTCPSAVKSDFTPWWGNHMDSPSLFCMMVYDYVNNTQDLSLLDEEVDGVSVLTKVRTVLDRLSEKADDTGLLVKSGKYNRLDWADEVNRYGYVAYDEILYARALYCVGKLTGLKKDPASTRYEERFRTVTAAINEVLWDETLGYYVNFKNEDYTEKNLSVDTVLAAVFGIADGARAKRLLANCEKLLESRSHAEIEDFGVMCVYPPYERINAACNKSACPMNYHNGAEWPYWSAMYAYARKLHGLEHSYALTRWFEYNTMRGNYTPIEYDSPYCEDGSLLQAWSSAAAFVYFDEQGMFFKNKI